MALMWGLLPSVSGDGPIYLEWPGWVGCGMAAWGGSPLVRFRAVIDGSRLRLGARSRPNPVAPTPVIPNAGTPERRSRQDKVPGWPPLGPIGSGGQILIDVRRPAQPQSFRSLIGRLQT